MSDQPEKPPQQKLVIWIPPDDRVIEKFARDVCERLGSEYSKSEIRDGFAQFIKLVCRIKVKHLNKAAEVEALDDTN